MTTVEVNRIGTDQTSIDIFQTGSHESEVALRHDLLDSKLNYHFAVTSLSVPLNNTPIFKLTNNVLLFSIERRDVGNTVNADLRLHVPGGNVAANRIVPPLGDFIIRPNKKFFDVSSFVKDLSNTVRGFNQYWTYNGFNPTLGGYSGVGQVLPALNAAQIAAQGGNYQLLGIRLTADGTLQLVGSSDFWNNFIIRFTREGSAILGYYDQILGVNRGAPVYAAPQTDYYISRTFVAGVFTNVFADPATGQIDLGNMVQESLISSSHPLYQSVDQRIKCSVEWHGPSSGNIVIIDQKEQTDRTIAEAFFESKLENQIKFDEQGIFDSMTMSSAMYSGQTNFIRKSQQNFQWNRLLTAYELKLFRFQIYIWYRTWNDTTQQWLLSKDKLVVAQQAFWELSVRFVSDS